MFEQTFKNIDDVLWKEAISLPSMVAVVEQLNIGSGLEPDVYHEDCVLELKLAEACRHD